MKTTSIDDPDFVPEFDLIVGDLSFISQTLVLPAVVPLAQTRWVFADTGQATV
jgi:predicted rRNA methylase YqxC with S4 and FtsJ domains